MTKEATQEKAPRDKRAAFVNLVNARTGKAMTAISVIGNLANPNSYEYTADDVNKLEAALQAEVSKTIARFRNPAASKKEGYKLL